MAISRIARLGIEIDTSKVPAAERRINNLGDSGRTAGKAMKGLAVAAAAVVTSLAVRRLIDAADAYTNINNRLKQATTSAEAFARAQDDVGQIAQRTFSDIQGVTVLYARLGRQSQELGITQQQVARTTETITKAIQLSGASAQESAGAVRQLAQGLAAGALRGEEFNSVAENAPRLLEILKTELGATTGELRAMAAEGELTSERIITAFENQSEAIDREFKNFTPTVAAGLETIESGFVELAGAINDATGASEAIAGVMLRIGEGASIAAEKIRDASNETSELQKIEEELVFGAQLRLEVEKAIRKAESDGNTMRLRELREQRDEIDQSLDALIKRRDLLNEPIATAAEQERKDAFVAEYGYGVGEAEAAQQAKEQLNRQAIEQQYQYNMGQTTAVQELQDRTDAFVSLYGYGTGEAEAAQKAREQQEDDAFELINQGTNIYAEALANRGDIEDQFYADRLAADQAYAQTKQNLDQKLISSAVSTSGALVNAAQQFAGKQSAAYKVAFAAQQAFVVASIIANTQAAAAAAVAPPPIGLGPAGAGYAAALTASGYTRAAIVGALAVGQLAGIGSGGSSANPSSNSGGSSAQDIQTPSRGGSAPQSVNQQVTVNFSGAADREEIAAALRDVFSDDGILFDQDSAQAQVLING